MPKVKTGDLIGATLDWAVAQCEGLSPIFTRHYVTPSHIEDPKKICISADSWVQPFEPSTNWAQGGPIIEREDINSGTQRNEPGFRPHPNFMWHAQRDGRVCTGYGPTLLIAAMRCYVASKLGEFVDVPDELD